MGRGSAATYANVSEAVCHRGKSTLFGRGSEFQRPVLHPGPCPGQVKEGAWGLPREDWGPSATYSNSVGRGEDPLLPYEMHVGEVGMQIAADAIYEVIAKDDLLELEASSRLDDHSGTTVSR